MGYGDRWRRESATFWNQIAARSTGTTATEELLALLEGKTSVIEVGCGAGHLAAALFKRDFQGSYWGCDIGPRAIEAATVRLDHPRAQFAVGDFFDFAREGAIPPAAVLFSREVVQHHAHWLPYVVVGLRFAEIVAFAVTRGSFLTESGAHRVEDRGEFYNVQISLPLLEREAAAAGIDCHLKRSKGPHGQEVAAVFWRRRA